MKRSTLIIFATFIATFLLCQFSFAQTYNPNGSEIKLGSNMGEKASNLENNLIGFWRLNNTIRYENGDTIVQEPSLQLWRGQNAKAFTEISIDSLRNFQIEQQCMKCPLLLWSGQCQIEKRTENGINFLYLNFIDIRFKDQKKRLFKKPIALEFSGRLKRLLKDEMILVGKDGREWIYHRLKEKDKSYRYKRV